MLEKNTIYRHFKGGQYVYLDTVHCVETNKIKVLYRDMAGKKYVRNFSVFCGMALLINGSEKVRIKRFVSTGKKFNLLRKLVNWISNKLKKLA